MRLATWRPVKPLPHAAFAAFERDDVNARAVLNWHCDAGWVLSVWILGPSPREVGQIRLAGPHDEQPAVGDATFGWADDMAERATR